jgi:hypothetical protein
MEVSVASLNSVFPWFSTALDITNTEFLFEYMRKMHDDMAMMLETSKYARAPQWKPCIQVSLSKREDIQNAVRIVN